MHFDAAAMVVAVFCTFLALTGPRFVKKRISSSENDQDQEEPTGIASETRQLLLDPTSPLDGLCHAMEEAAQWGSDEEAKALVLNLEQRQVPSLHPLAVATLGAIGSQEAEMFLLDRLNDLDTVEFVDPAEQQVDPVYTQIKEQSSNVLGSSVGMLTTLQQEEQATSYLRSVIASLGACGTIEAVEPLRDFERNTKDAIITREVEDAIELILDRADERAGWLSMKGHQGRGQLTISSDT